MRRSFLVKMSEKCSEKDWIPKNQFRAKNDAENFPNALPSVGAFKSAGIPSLPLPELFSYFLIFGNSKKIRKNSKNIKKKEKQTEIGGRFSSRSWLILSK